LLAFKTDRIAVPMQNGKQGSFAPIADDAGFAVGEINSRHRGEYLLIKKREFGSFGRKRSARGSKRDKRAHKKVADSTDSGILKMALKYGAQGVPVFPLYGMRDGSCACGNPECSTPGNHPHVKEATTDPKLIRKYWKKWPKARIGMPLGSMSGFLAVVTDGTAGVKSLRAIEETAK
jgi:hypothetical protein